MGPRAWVQPSARRLRSDALFRRYDFLLMGSPQHAMEPSAPLVTTNSELHLLHEYRLPVSLANFHRLLTSILERLT